MSVPQPDGQPLLVLENVSKTYEASARAIRALHAVSFDQAAGEFVCLLGPSGSGKSTLLRIVGGLVRPNSGQVWLGGERITEPRREIGFVFQSNNLMPWRTVVENVLLPVEVQKGRSDEDDRRHACQLLTLVGLAGFETVYPRQLSGGMRQRVVLARTLIHRPQLLLMDEPFGALDALTRERLNVELLRIHELQAKTILMVTHSIAEAVFLADRIIVLSERPGRVVAQVAIDLPRPRTIDMTGSEHFARLTMEVRYSIAENPAANWRSPLQPEAEHR